MGIQSDSAIAKGYELIEAGKPLEAKEILEDALTSNLEDLDLVFFISCCSFWLEPYESLSRLDFFEQGECLVNHWKRFEHSLLKNENYSEKTVYIFKKAVFSQALKAYSQQLDDSNPQTKAETYRKTGLCYKKLGSYEKGLACLSKANELLPGNAPVLAEMADCYALCGEDKMAKVLFREAFFIDAQKIDLYFLDSPLLTLLKEQVEKKGYSGKALAEWIPVYGKIYGVFNVTRELRSLESGKIRQEIYARENELKDPKNDSTVITPRLLNLYFWLIDHYMTIKESVQKINEVLLKIKILDPAVYEIYVK